MKEQMQIPLSLCHTTRYLPNYVQIARPETTFTRLPRPTPLRLQEPPTLLIPLPLQDSNHGLRALTRRLGPMLRFVLSHMSANNLQPHAQQQVKVGVRKRTLGPRLLSVNPGQKQNTFHPWGPYS